MSAPWKDNVIRHDTLLFSTLVSMRIPLQTGLLHSLRVQISWAGTCFVPGISLLLHGLWA